MRKKLYYPIFSSVFIGMVLLLITSLNPSYAQGPVEELSGWFSIVWGDSEEGKSSTVHTLRDSNGQETMLQLDETLIENLGGVLKFNGKYVSAQGTLATTSGSYRQSASVQVSQSVLNVTSISPAPLLEPQTLTIDGAYSAASGAFPWVTIMCKFSDITDEPKDVDYFDGMYSSTKPGMDHYWMEQSFNQVDVTGSSVGGTGWYDLPNPEIYYNPTDTSGGTDIYLLADECLAAADDDIDYSFYDGINMMFNSNFDNGYAWGGAKHMTLDGVTKTWRTTWEPPWAYQNISVLAHEMGHGFGLPHSTAPGGSVYDNPWDVMSQPRYNCAAGSDPIYGCMAQHTISYHKDLLGWIPEARIITVSDGTSTTVTLKDLAAPASSNYQMVKIPIGETTNFYTVEARKFTGYDVKLPDEGIVIHDVDTTRSVDTVLDSDGSSTNLWSVGETFIDAANNILVTVNADTGTGFEVTINNDYDTDNDGIPDSSDNCPATWNAAQNDIDGDGIGTWCDNCPYNCNTQQLDADYDGIGDVCDTEDDGCDGCGNGPICETECFVGNYTHSPMPSSCNACHEDTRPSGPHPKIFDCAECHVDAGNSWMGATYDHSPSPTTCTFCHESIRPSDPHPQIMECVVCHSNPGGSWLGATYDHSPSPTTCNACHESNRPADPHPQTLDCAECHLDGGNSWLGATYDHTPAPTSCTLCHEINRPADPHPQTQDCTDCHSNPGGSWLGATYDHTPAPTSCTLCHEDDLPTNQHPQGLECVICHIDAGKSWRRY